VVLLLISNLGILFYFLYSQKPPNPKPDQKPSNKSIVSYVQKKVGLTDDQAAQYEILINQHHDSLKILSDSNRVAKLAFFKLLMDSTVTEEKIQSALHRVGSTQEAIEMNNFLHFKNVRALCKGDQLPKFDSLLVRFVNRSSGKPPRSGSH
jgi:hypothetical protein